MSNLIFNSFGYFMSPSTENDKYLKLIHFFNVFSRNFWFLKWFRYHFYINLCVSVCVSVCPKVEFLLSLKKWIFTKTDVKYKILQSWGHWWLYYCAMGHWDTRMLGHWDIGIPGHWDTLTLGHLDTGTLVHWNTGIPGHWDIGTLGQQKTRINWWVWGAHLPQPQPCNFFWSWTELSNFVLLALHHLLYSKWPFWSQGFNAETQLNHK